MAFKKLQHLRQASPSFDSGGVGPLEPRGEIVVERYDPAGARHFRVGDSRLIAFTGDHAMGGRQIAKPYAGRTPGPHGADESGVGVDPRGAGGGRLGRTIVEHLYAGPDALIGSDDGVGAA